MTLPPQVLAQLMQGLSKTGAQAPNGQNISFANSGGASPPMGVSGGAGAGVGGGGMQQAAHAGSNVAGLNRMVGASAGGNSAGLGSEGSLQAGQTSQMANPQNVNTAISTLTDLTSGVGPPLGTSYGTPTQGNMTNPSGPVGNSEQGAFDIGSGIGGTGTASAGATVPNGTGPGSYSMGQDLQNLIQPGDKSNMGRTIPNKMPAQNSLNVNQIYPQTGLAPYRGVLG